jgi:hypothetical protein
VHVDGSVELARRWLLISTVRKTMSNMSMPSSQHIASSTAPQRRRSTRGKHGSDLPLIVRLPSPRAGGRKNGIPAYILELTVFCSLLLPAPNPFVDPPPPTHKVASSKPSRSAPPPSAPARYTQSGAPPPAAYPAVSPHKHRSREQPSTHMEPASNVAVRNGADGNRIKPNRSMTSAPG